MSEAFRAAVPTPSASRYLQQLAKHWSHRMTVTFSAEEGAIDFPNAARLEMRVTSGTLLLDLHVPAGVDAAHMRRVVEEHLDRFAFREGPLSYDWQAA